VQIIPLTHLTYFWHKDPMWRSKCDLLNFPVGQELLPTKTAAENDDNGFDTVHDDRSWWWGGGSWPPANMYEGQSMCDRPKMSHSCIHNCCRITLQVSHHQGWKTCVKKRKVKLIFWGTWNSLMALPNWLWPPILWQVYATNTVSQ